MVTTINANSESYLYLKQLVCLIGIMRLKRSIKIYNKEVNYEQALKQAFNLVNKLQDSFEVPVNTLRTDRSTIDFEMIRETVSNFNNFNTNNDNLKHKQINQSDIFIKPYKDKLFEYLKGLHKENKIYTDQRVSISRILEQVEYLFNAIVSYIQSEESSIPLSKVVFNINLLDAIEFLFVLAEESETVFDN